MKLLSDALKEKRFDVRMVRSNISRSMISNSELDQFVGSLPDDQTISEYRSISDLGKAESKSHSNGEYRS